LSRGFAGVWRRSAFQKGRDATVEYHTADGHPERLSAARYAIQAISTNRQFTFTGGLMNYRPVEREVHCLVGSYTGRIFKGEKPTDLPVQQSTRLELINLKTAKAFSLTFPTGLLVRADEVIE
jgi:putative ABC transport system substrate-binding protein